MPRTHETAPVRSRVAWGAGLVVALLAVGWALLAWVTIPGPGLERAAEDADFRACAEDAGVEVDDAGDLSAEQEAERWASPGLLACAESTFDDDELAAVTERLFQPNRTGVTGMLTGAGPACDLDQNAPLKHLGHDAAAAGGQDAGVEAAGRVLRARPDGQRGLTSVDFAAAFGILEATGTLPGYVDFVERNADSGYDRDELDVIYLQNIFRRPSDAPQEFTDRFDTVLGPLAEAAQARATTGSGC